MTRRLRAIARLLVSGLALTLVLGAAGAQAATCIGSAGKRCAYDRIATYGERAPGELRQPMAVAVGPGGEIYVVDAQARNDIASLFVYDRSGRFLHALAPPAAKWYAPTDVGVGADGTVYVLDPGSAVMHRFDPDGGYRGLRLPVARADRLAVQSDGTFWLLYAGSSTVTHSDSDGHLIGGFTVRADRDSALAVDSDGHVLIGRWNQGATEYTPDGSELRTIPSTFGAHVALAGNGDLVTGVGDLIYRIPRSGAGSTVIGWSDSNGAGLSQVDGIAVAPPGLMAAGRPREEAYIVADRDNSRVQVLATDGSRLAIVGAPQDATLMEPRAAWGLPGGSMIVADTGHRRLVQIAASGAFEGRADGGADSSFPLDGALNPVTGDSVIVDGGFDLRRFGADGASLGSWSMPGVVESASNSGFGGGVAVAADGTIWAAHSPAPHGGYLAAYRPDGTPLRTVTEPHLDRPSSIATGPGGEVFVVEGGGANTSVVDVFGPDGSFRRRLDSLSCLWVSSLAVDGAGRIYAGQRDRVTVLDRSGALLARFGAAGGAVGQFEDTKLSVLGDVLTIADWNNSRVTRVRIDPAALTSPDPDPCGGVRMVQTTIVVQGAVAQVPLDCNGTHGAICDGAVTLLRSSVKAGRPLKRTDILATASYSVGGASVVALKLKKAERKVLSKKRRLKARVVVRPKRGAAITRRVMLTLPSKAKAKAKATAKSKSRASKSTG